MSNSIKGALLTKLNAEMVSGGCCENTKTGENMPETKKFASGRIRSGGDGNGDLPPKKVG